MQNTAAIVFQGEAEWGWLSLQHGATPGPICSLSRHSSMVVSPGSISGYPVLSTSLQFSVQDFFSSKASLLSAPQLGLCSSALWPVLCSKIC